MKTWIVILGLLLTATTGFGMGHPHNLFAARHRLVARLQAARQTPATLIARSLPTKSNSPSPTASCQTWLRPLLPGRFLGLRF